MKRLAIVTISSLFVSFAAAPRAGLGQDGVAGDPVPVIDPTDTGTGGRVTYEELIKVPTARDPWQVLSLIPGVQTGGIGAEPRTPTHVMLGPEGVSAVDLEAAIEAGFPLDPAVVGENFLVPAEGATPAGVTAPVGDQRVLNWAAIRDENRDFEANTRGAFRIEDNASSIPRDRFFLHYDHFRNTPSSCLGVAGKMFGFEKTFFDNTAGVETRLPYVRLEPAPLDDAACGDLDAAIQAGAFRGLRSLEFGGEVGGPIVKDPLWFTGTFNLAQTTGQPAGAPSHAQDRLPGDGDLDGDVDADDYTLWRNSFGTTATGGEAVAGDYDANGIVDAADYVVWRKNFGSTGPAPSPGNVAVTGQSGNPPADPATGAPTVTATGWIFNQRIDVLPETNVPAVRSAPILMGPQDGGLELFGGTRVSVAPSEMEALAGASPARAGRGADDPAGLLDGPMI